MGGYVRDEDRSLRAWFVVLALAFGVVTVWAVVDEGWIRRPWKRWQSEYDARHDGKIGVAIRQVVAPKIGVIDRCTSCHAGVNDDQMVGAEVPAVLRVHPRREVLLAKHPTIRYGCTPCHNGQGLALTAGTAHGEADPHWPSPLLKPPYSQSTCLACHPGDESLVDAPLLGAGRRLFRELACTGCHATDDQDELQQRAPSLKHVDSKLHRGWMLQWIRDPKVRRRGYQMPNFWPGAADDPAMAKRRDEESLAIAAYLVSASAPWPAAQQAPPQDPSLVEAGGKLFDTVGCRGCHELGVPDKDTLALRDPTVQEEAAEDSWASFGEEEEAPEAVPAPAAVSPIDFGPKLGDLRERAKYPFVFAWLMSPEAYWRHAKMPDFRLSQNEAHALASWSITQGPEPVAVPDALTGTLDPALIARGKKLVGEYGCAGCHEIVGFEDAGRPGPDLIDFGRKDPHDLFFGDHPPPKHERTWDRYTRAKLADARGFETAEIRQVMPQYVLTDEENQALAVYLRALLGKPVHPDYVHDPKAARLKRQGERLIEERGCQNCHTLDGRSGDILRHYADAWLAPPALDDVGGKLQPQFLFRYLSRPGPLRPWLALRMPRFRLSADEADLLVRHFAAKANRPAPFRTLALGTMTAERAAAGARFFEQLKCVSCHMLQGGGKLKTAELAPDLGLARQRLDPIWVRNFLVNPGKVLPGTRMPQFFPEGQTPAPELLNGDAEAQIRLLVDHLMNLGLQPAGQANDDRAAAGASDGSGP